MDRESKHMRRVLTAKILQKNINNMFEHIKISETIYERVVEPSNEKLLQ